MIYLYEYCRGTDEECNVIYVKIDENLHNNYFSIYPNPADDLVRIHFFKSDFQDHKDIKFIFNDVYARIICEMNIVSDDNEININTSHIPNGLYFLSLIVAGKEHSTEKLIIAR